MHQSRNILLITNIPTPYRVPLFEELSQLLEVRGYTLHVVFGGSSYARRNFKIDPAAFRFNHVFLDGSKVERRDVERTSFLYRGLGKELRRLSPELVIVSGFSAATLQLFLRGIPYIIWNGSVSSGYRKEGFLKRMYRKLLARKAVGFVAYGTKAKSYLEQLGAPSSGIAIGINTVDTSFFSRETEKQRRMLGREESTMRLLAISYLSPRKRIDLLIEFARALKARRKDFVLDVVGDGSDRPLLEELVTRYALTEQVRFHGHLQREALPPLLATASMFLFQTDFDIWGLTLNEAMAAGLPVACSPNAGAAADLIHEGETGFMIDYHHSEAAAERIDRLLDQPELLQRVGTMAGSFISRKVTLEISARGFWEAIHKAIGKEG